MTLKIYCVKCNREFEIHSVCFGEDKHYYLQIPNTDVWIKIREKSTYSLCNKCMVPINKESG